GDRAERAAYLARLKREGKFHSETRHRRSDGSTFPIEVTTALITVGGRELVLGLDRDITQRKQTEQALAEERNLLRTVIDILPYDFFIKDRDGRFIINNRSHARSVGVAAPAEVVSKTSADFFAPLIAAQQHADDQTVIRSGQPILNRERLTRSFAGDERWLLTSKVPLRDTQENITGVVGISQDITERKYTENELRKSLGTNRALLNPTPALILTLPLDGTMAACQGGKNWGLAIQPKDIINKHVYQVVPRNIARQSLKCVQQAVYTGETQLLECQLTLHGKA